MLRSFVVDFGAWASRVFLLWVSKAGGSLVAFGQLLYGLKYREWPPMITWAILGFSLLVAAFLAWREQYQKAKALTKEECLYKTVESLKTPQDIFREVFNHLYMAQAYNLRSNDDLIWVCDKLVEGKHGHPFDHLEECVLQNEWLDFMKWGRIAKWDFREAADYLHAAGEWKMEVKGRIEPEQKRWRGIAALAYDKLRQPPR